MRAEVATNLLKNIIENSELFSLFFLFKIQNKK
jgi:hypothetical protein